MERVTQKDERGYYLTGDGIYSDWGTPEKFRGDDVDRLAAYEETGLEPEEIELLAKQRDLYVDACGELPLKRIRELAQADREGRCAIIPESIKGVDITVYSKDWIGTKFRFRWDEAALRREQE